MLLNLTLLTVQTASGPVGEARPDKCSLNQSPGRAYTRVRQVVHSIKNLSTERNRNQRLRETCGEVTKDRGFTVGHSENLERKVTVSGQESCKKDSTEKSTDKDEDRGCKAETR